MFQPRRMLLLPSPAVTATRKPVSSEGEQGAATRPTRAPPAILLRAPRRPASLMPCPESMPFARPTRTARAAAASPLLVVLSLLAGCGGGAGHSEDEPAVHVGSAGAEKTAFHGEATATATLAGGCFWCVEATFEKVPGVAEVVSGYTGGHDEDPDYESVCRGVTGTPRPSRSTSIPSR